MVDGDGLVECLSSPWEIRQFGLERRQCIKRTEIPTLATDHRGTLTGFVDSCVDMFRRFK